MNRPKIHDGVALIEVDDPMMLAEITSDASLAGHLGECLSDRCVVVHPNGVSEVVKRLQSLGHMPRVIDPSSIGPSRITQ